MLRGSLDKMVLEAVAVLHLSLELDPGRGSVTVHFEPESIQTGEGATLTPAVLVMPSEV